MVNKAGVPSPNVCLKLSCSVWTEHGILLSKVWKLVTLTSACLDSHIRALFSFYSLIWKHIWGFSLRKGYRVGDRTVAVCASLQIAAPNFTYLRLDLTKGQCDLLPLLFLSSLSSASPAHPHVFQWIMETTNEVMKGPVDSAWQLPTLHLEYNE